MLGKLSNMFGADSAEDEKKKKAGALENGGGLAGAQVYFSPKNRIQDGANSLSQTPSEEPGMYDKAREAFRGALGTGDKSDIGALYGDEVDFDDPANDELLGVIADEEADGAAGPEKEGVDWESFSRMLGSINDPNAGRQVSSSAYRAGFRAPDQSLYENPLLKREYQQLYSQPLYNKLV